MTTRSVLFALCLAAPFAALPGTSCASEAGFTPQFPFPVLGAEARPARYDSYDLPIAPWANGSLPVETFEGQVDRRAWQLAAGRASLLEVLVPLRDQLTIAGYEIVMECEARRCGGFDFRFATEILPEPGMHVDLNEFRFIAARRGDEALGLLASRSASAAFVQIISVGKEALPPPIPGSGVPVAGMPVPGMPVTGISERGSATSFDPAADEAAGVHAKPVTQASGVAAGGVGLLDAGLPYALDDLVFETGSSALSDRDYASLAALAAWLKADPARKVILVGHTDMSGPLEGNIALSKRRAGAVRAALIEDFGLAAGRISAEGAGPLAPRAGNDSEEGRQKNRRVEAIPAPT